VWNSEERRRRADNDWGYALYLGITYYGLWILAAARTLVYKKHISLTELPGSLAARGARGVPINTSSRGGGARRGFQSEVPLHGSACAPRRHREMDREATCRNRYARLHDWRGLAAARQDRRRSSRSESGPARPGLGRIREVRNGG
jgi:hypothetical protein